LGCFGGIRVILLGYRKEQYQTIEKTILKYDGFLTDSLEQAELIILKNSLITSEESKILEKYLNKTVIEKWYEDCVSNKKFIKPDNYLYKEESFKSKFELIINKYSQSKNDLVTENLD